MFSRKNGAQKTDEKENDSNVLRPGQSFAEDDPPKVQNSRKSSMARVMNRILYNPNRKEVHSDRANPAAVGAASGEGLGGRLGVTSELGQIDRASYQNQFRLRGIQSTDHKILQMSRNTLLAVISEFSAYYSRVGSGGGGTVGRKFSSQMMRKVSTLHASVEPSEVPTKITMDPNSVVVRQHSYYCDSIMMYGLKAGSRDANAS